MATQNCKAKLNGVCTQKMSGELSDFRKAMPPIVAALGGMLAPALLYLAFNSRGEGVNGWAIPMATDIAFALGILSLFGKRVPVELKVFLTALAIGDDIGAVLVIALVYTESILWSALIAALVLLALVALLSRIRMRGLFFYILLSIFAWLAVYQSGLHATVAGILVALAVPARPRRDPDQFFQEGCQHLEEMTKTKWTPNSVLTNSYQKEVIQRLNRAARDLEPPLTRLEHSLHPYVAFLILPLFALANAGVVVNSQTIKGLFQPTSLGIILGLLVGKQVGITLLTWLAVRLGIAQLPDGIGIQHIYVLSWLAGIGFTMSLFISDLAFSDPNLVNQARMGILLGSLLAALGGYLVLNKVLARKTLNE